MKTIERTPAEWEYYSLRELHLEWTILASRDAYWDTHCHLRDAGYRLSSLNRWSHTQSFDKFREQNRCEYLSFSPRTNQIWADRGHFLNLRINLIEAFGDYEDLIHGVQSDSIILINGDCIDINLESNNFIDLDTMTLSRPDIFTIEFSEFHEVIIHLWRESLRLSSEEVEASLRNTRKKPLLGEESIHKDLTDGNKEPKHKGLYLDKRPNCFVTREVVLEVAIVVENISWLDPVKKMVNELEERIIKKSQRGTSVFQINESSGLFGFTDLRWSHKNQPLSNLGCYLGVRFNFFNEERLSLDFTSQFSSKCVAFAGRSSWLKKKIDQKAECGYILEMERLVVKDISSGIHQNVQKVSDILLVLEEMVIRRPGKDLSNIVKSTRRLPMSYILGFGV